MWKKLTKVRHRLIGHIIRQEGLVKSPLEGSGGVRIEEGGQC